MNRYKSLLLVICVTSIGIFGCQKNESSKSSQQPPKEEQTQIDNSKPMDSYLDTEIGMWTDSCDGKTLRQFIEVVNSEMSSPGVWERINDKQWIYIVIRTDPVTTNSAEFRLLFSSVMDTRNGSGPLIPYIYLDRLVINKRDVSDSLKSQFFTSACGSIK